MSAAPRCSAPGRPSAARRPVHPGVRSGALVTLVAAALPAAARAQEPSAPLPAPTAAATRGEVRGVVRDSAGARVSGARVTLVDLGGREAGATTDAAGAFAIVAPGPGRHVLRVRALGYRPAAREVDVGAGGLAALTVVLDPTRVLAPVTVVGAGGAERQGHPGSTDVLTSVSVLSGEQVARENVQFAQEVLRKVPGVYHANFNQGIVSGEVAIRGFNTETDVGSTKLLVDGIPTNLNSGLGEFNALFPLEIDRIEIVRGTNDPRYGLFNLAGNVSVATRQGGSYLAARALGGSFGTGEAQAVVAREHALGRDGRGGTLSQTWFGGYRTSGGYRANAALDKRAGSGKLFYTSAGRRVTTGVIARLQALDTDAPGYLSLAESRAAPRTSPAFSNSDGGTVDTRQLSAHLDVQQTPTLLWSARAYTQRFERVRWVRFSASGAQQERVEDERQDGALAQVTWRPAAFADAGRGPGALLANLALSAGADWQAQDNVQQRFRAQARVREATLRDYAFTFDNGGGFARLDATFGGRLTVDAGLRLDRVGGEFRNLQTGAVLPALDYGWIPQPKASATLALGRALSLYGNYGRGFQVGTGVAGYVAQPAAGTAPAAGRPLTYSRNDGYEAGVVVQPLAAVRLRAGAWRQNAADEVRLRFDNSGDSENVGRTRRTGLDVEATVRPFSAGPLRTVSLWSALTTQRSILVEPGPLNAEARGKRLNHVPDWTAKYGADWSPTPRVNASFWAYGQGDYHLIDANTLPTFGGYTAVNADLSVRLARGVAVGLALQNAFDRYYEFVWFDGTQTQHSPGNARGLAFTVSLDR